RAGPCSFRAPGSTFLQSGKMTGDEVVGGYVQPVTAAFEAQQRNEAFVWRQREFTLEVFTPSVRTWQTCRIYAEHFEVLGCRIVEIADDEIHFGVFLFSDFDSHRLLSSLH